VTAPLYLVADRALDDVLAGAGFVLDGDEGRHAATVRRTRVGERVDVGDGVRLARCTVVRVSPGSLDLRVELVEDVPVLRPRLVLVQALAKGGRDELAVETATELGMDAVVPWQAGRSVVVWAGERGERARRKWESVARAAAKQSRRPQVPAVERPVTTARLAERIRAGVAGGGSALVLHEDADQPLADVVLPADGDLLVVVGPEGGIGSDELTALTDAGGRAVRLGPQVLRTSSAGAAALAVLSVRLGRWT
jgi:16S rRNA (uracil1498-N3)-methyltransferase